MLHYYNTTPPDRMRSNLVHFKGLPVYFYYGCRVPPLSLIEELILNMIPSFMNSELKFKLLLVNGTDTQFASRWSCY